MKGLEARPEADNLVGIYAGLAETGKERVLAEFGNAPFSKFKEALAELAATRLTPIGEEMRRLMADPLEIDGFLAEGASPTAADQLLTLDPGPNTKDIVGFIRANASGFDAVRIWQVTPGAAKPAIARPAGVLGGIAGDSPRRK